VLGRPRHKAPRRPPFERLQAWSGAYLALFLLVHVVSVLSGRAMLDLDTNFWLAAGVMLAALVAAAFSGAFYAVDLPAAYRATFA